MNEKMADTLETSLSFDSLRFAPELILCAAEELFWATWIDDPLPRQAGMNAKVRLHDTIKDLNRRQHPYVIQFKGDGTGTRVGWEYR